MNRHISCRREVRLSIGCGEGSPFDAGLVAGKRESILRGSAGDGHISIGFRYSVSAGVEVGDFHGACCIEVRLLAGINVGRSECAAGVGDNACALRFADDSFRGPRGFDFDILHRSDFLEVHAALAGDLHIFRIGCESRLCNRCPRISCVGKLATGGVGAILDGAVVGHGECALVRRIVAAGDGAMVGDGERAGGGFVVAILYGAIVIEHQVSAGECTAHQRAGCLVVDGELVGGFVAAILQLFFVVHHDITTAQGATGQGALVFDMELFHGGDDIFIHESVLGILYIHSLPLQSRAGDAMNRLIRAIVLHIQGLGGNEGASIHPVIVGEYGILPFEGTAGDGALVVHLERAIGFVEATTDGRTVRQDEVQVSSLDGGLGRVAISEEGNLRTAAADGLDGADGIFIVARSEAHHPKDLLTAIVFLGSVDAKAQGGGIILTLHILGVDEDTLAFDVHIGGLFAFRALLSQEAILLIIVFEVDGHIAFGSVDGIHDEIAISLLEVYAVPCAGGEDAAADDGCTCDSAATGFKDEILAATGADDNAV